ncbi:MAG: murein hydrolase activator EnvC family protein [Gammaproteobacteria bacterium]
MPLTETRKHRRVRPAPLLLCIGALAVADIGAQEDDARRQQLESVRTEINQVESGLREARSESELLYAELQQLEADTLQTEIGLQQLDAELKSSDTKLQLLDEQQTDVTARLTTERAKLARHLRAAYITGRHNVFRLVLNQENPARMSRLVTYHGYFNSARVRQIEAIDYSLLYVAELKRQITLEDRANQELHQAQQAKLTELAGLQQQRQQVLDKLHAHIADQDNHLKTLRRTEAELSELLEQLTDAESVGSFEDIPPFASLRGKLSWPVRGKIAVAFGASKRGGRTRATGVTFNTQSGTEVKAIAGGRVVFADWFSNLGLLLIIDHGSDYMSLYGHNARILKRKGDWVQADEIISRAGETGGRRQAGLYFEIRKKATPVNPLLWCKR